MCVLSTKKNSAYQVSKLVLDVWYAQYYKPLGHEASKPLNSGYLIYRIIKILLKVWLLGFQTYLDFVSPNQIVDVWWSFQNKAGGNDDDNTNPDNNNNTDQPRPSGN